MPDPTSHQPASDDAADRLFAVWRTVMGQPDAEATPAQRQQLQQALTEHSETDCEYAIRGSVHSDPHVERIGRFVHHVPIEVIFGDDARFADFVTLHLRAATAEHELQEYLEDEGWL